VRPMTTVSLQRRGIRLKPFERGVLYVVEPVPGEVGRVASAIRDT